jgi:magnesium-transporting ATPase (P-type)
MLTGDKLETAENIARSCNLVEPKMEIFYIKEENEKDVKEILLKHYHTNK